MTAGHSIVVAGFLSIGIISCGESGSDEPVNPSTIPMPSEPIGVPKPSRQQKTEAVKIAEQNPAFQQLSDGRNRSYKAVGAWTRTNQELLGAAIEFTLAMPGSYDALPIS